VSSVILTFAVAIAVGTLLIYVFSRWIGRVKLTLATAFWTSAIGHIVPGLIQFALGYLLSHYWARAFIIGILVAIQFQAMVLQAAARTQNEVMRPWPATFIALIVIVGDFLIASPIVELIQRGTSR
jgi:hypothetical protein